MKATEKSLKSTLSPVELNMMSRKALFKYDKARKAVGYEPKVNVESGLKMTVSWLRHHGFELS
jgi:nucleoside-diphosphate-sugar epimerase